MKQILILRGKNDDLMIVNLSEIETYTLSFSTARSEEDHYLGKPLIQKIDDFFVGTLCVTYARKRLRINIQFENKEDVIEFEETLIDYLKNGATSINPEDGAFEFKYWMEFNVMEVQYVHW